MKQIITIFAMMTLVFTGCTSSKKFTSRKYMSGRYFSFASHQKHESRPGTADKKRLPSPKKSENPATASIQGSELNQTKQVDLKSTSITNALPKVKQSKSSMLASARRLPLINKVKEIKPLLAFEKIKTIRQKQEKAESKPSSGIALTAVILSGLGIVMDVTSFIVLAVLEEYIFLVFAGLGLTLGLAGLILGISSMSKYKRDKANGQKKTTTLVLGIIATALGGVAMILALYFTAFGLLYLSF